MNKSERVFIIVILSLVSTVITIDLLTDSQDGASWWHLMIEGAAASIAMLGVFYLIRGSYKLRFSLKVEKEKSIQLEIEAVKWRTTAKKNLEGLSEAIDGQLAKWGLSNSEREVALWLLKGLSLKEIAKLRNTAEKTARTQSISIYSKTGLRGRSGLAAFFLNDLFLPSIENPHDREV